MLRWFTKLFEPARSGNPLPKLILTRCPGVSYFNSAPELDKEVLAEEEILLLVRMGFVE